MTTSGLALESIVVVAPDVLSSRLGSEQVVLNLRDGTYYGLDDVGSEIWALLEHPITIGEICDAVVESYDVDLDRCRRDVVRLMDDLVRRRLVEVRPFADV
jgi:hypothetical protein